MRRARRSDLGAVFGLIEHTRGGALSPNELVDKATGYGYLIAEERGRMLGVAGILVENSIACVRDLHTTGGSARSVATAVLLVAIENEAEKLACEVIIVEVPPGAPAVESLLRDWQYAPRTLEQLRNSWREVAREQFAPGVPLWVNHLRETRY